MSARDPALPPLIPECLEEQLCALLDHAPMSVAMLDRDLRYLACSRRWTSDFGAGHACLVGRDFRAVHPDLDAGWQSIFQRGLDGETVQRDEDYWAQAGGTGLWLRWSVAPWNAGAGGGGIIITTEDITYRKLAESQLREQNEFLNSILQNEPECVKVVDVNGKLLQMNAAGLKMLGVESVEEARRAGLMGFILPEHRQSFYELHRAVCAGGSGVLEFEIRAQDGTHRWLQTHATHLRDAAGNVTALLGITRDITDNKRSTELIWRQANFDALTGLPNRYMFRDRIVQEIKKARRNDTRLALLYIDLDRFKEVNDTLGHEVGDKLLLEAARRIESCVRVSDTVARLGGDEFAVILTQVGDGASADIVAQKLIARLGEAFVVEHHASVISASIGIAQFPGEADTAEAMLLNADQAMYLAKGQGRNRVAHFTVQLQLEAQRRMNLLRDLREAVGLGQFVVHFQPIVDLRSGAICCAEALVRWLHPVRGLVAPGEFIPLAEETGLIADIGDWVFREAALWVSRWRALAPGFRASVNLSPLQLRDGARLHAWRARLEELGLPGNGIQVEITENMLLDASPGIAQALAELREAGIGISIDDFGTGYSSLSYLHKLKVDSLKIDQSFTRNIDAEQGVRTLCESIIAMAQKLGLQVVAEGVETEAQRAFLLAAGCDYAQGFLFSRPVPPADFERLLQQK